MFKLETMKRSDFIWLTLYSALILAVMLGFTDHYFGAFLCVCYDLFIVTCNLILETKKNTGNHSTRRSDVL